MTSIRDVIFDLDGTLVDSLPGIAWSVQFALTVCGIGAPCPDLKPLIGPPIREILAAISGVSDTHRLDRLEAAFRASYDEHGWRQSALHEGAAVTIAELCDRGLRVWIATNKNRRPAERILREFGLHGFEEVVCRDSRNPPFSSKGEMLRDLLLRRGLDAAECLMVGDSQEDWRAAADAGIACVLVAHGYGAPPSYPQRIEGWTELLELCTPGALPSVARAPHPSTRGNPYD